MKVAATPPIDHLVQLEPVSLHVGSAGLAGTSDALHSPPMPREPAAQASPSGTVELSAMGRTVAALASFGFPVVVVDDAASQPLALAEGAEPVLPGAPQPGVNPAELKPAASHPIAQALAAALSAQQPQVAEAPQPSRERRPVGEATAQPAPRADRAEAPRPPAQQAAGSLLNALLCAALTGQTAVEVQRRDRRPLRLELQREPDGQGGFRVTRVRVRHQTDAGFLEATAELGLPGCERGPMHVDIACSDALADEVAQQLEGLREALDARGLLPSVRSRRADAPSS